MNATIAHTLTESILIPEVKIESHNPAYRYEALRGYSGILAVFEDRICIGWIKVEALGFSTAKEWMNSVR
jgi:hypothetical protein